ncbi:MAG: hypothetical protein QOJ07_1630 [Thermoleophilaceae bacterium]|nr:hypothetical protein [Thermoleophilaceae bacterium]
MLLVVALGLFLAAGFPIAGWITATVAWLLQRGLRDYLAHRAANTDDPRSIVGYMAGSLIGRGWLVGLTIFGGYLASGQKDPVGLSAAVLFIAVFTLYFTVAMILRPFEQPGGAI